MSLDWFDIGTLALLNLLVDAGVVAFIAGYWSLRRIKGWLLSKESDPYIERIISRIPELPPLPAVPTVEQIVAGLPDAPNYEDRLNLLEERIGSKLTQQVDAKLAAFKEDLADRMSRVVQANIASAKSSFSTAQREFESAVGEGNDGSVLMELVGMFADDETVKKAGRYKKMLSRFRQSGGLGGMMGGGNGGGVPPGGYPFGTIINGYVATPNGWQPVQRAAAAVPPQLQSFPPSPAPIPDVPPIAPPELPPEPKAP